MSKEKNIRHIQDIRKDVVLLTASIDPKGCYYLKRFDPLIREMDYVKSLKSWIDKTDLLIVFCENSGYDLSRIRKIAEMHQNRVEIIQFNGNDFPRYLGKGYGEMKIIQRALAESKFIKDADYVVKVTGRIFVPNIIHVLNDLKVGVMTVNSRLYQIKGSGFCRSVAYIFKKDFFYSFHIKYAEKIDDSKGFSFERSLYEAIKDSSLCGYEHQIARFRLSGYSGTNNIRYSKINRKVIFELVDSYLGRFGLLINKISPFLYKKLRSILHFRK